MGVSGLKRVMVRLATLPMLQFYNRPILGKITIARLLDSSFCRVLTIANFLVSYWHALTGPRGWAGWIPAFGAPSRPTQSHLAQSADAESLQHYTYLESHTAPLTRHGSGGVIVGSVLSIQSGINRLYQQRIMLRGLIGWYVDRCPRQRGCAAMIGWFVVCDRCQADNRPMLPTEPTYS